MNSLSTGSSDRAGAAQASLTRRRLLTLLGVGAVATAGMPLLAACSGAASGGPATGPVSGSPSGTPAPGGTVRLAFVGGGSAESLDPFAGGSPADYARNYVLFDQLFHFLDGAAQSGLATQARPEPDGSSFTLHLREGVTWHDGSPFGAADVAYTLTYLASPDRPYPSELNLYLDVPRVVVVDEHTLTIPTLQPVGDPATLLAGGLIAVIKAGATSFEVDTVVGTGPYRMAAFQPGSESRLTRFDGYWGGAGNAEELAILSLDDPQARVNAVIGDQSDYASDIPYTVAKAGITGAGLQIRDAGAGQRTSYGFVLNMTRPLIADPRVRRALRLGIDRQALVDAVFLGYGVPANDLFGYGAKHFAQDVPVPERDQDEARRLLAEAGATGQPFIIRTAEYEVGLNASAELFAEQLRQLGLLAEATVVSPVELFDVAALQGTDAMSFPLGPFSLAVTYTRSAAYDALAFPDQELTDAVATALSTTSEQERAAAWQTAQQVMVDRGNWVVWGRGDVLSLARSNLTGIQVRESAKYPWLGTVGFAG